MVLLLSIVLTVAIPVAPTTYAQAGTIIRVTPTGTGDGTTWAQAAGLDDALYPGGAVTASSGAELWLQAGVYTPDDDGNSGTPPGQAATFGIPPGVALYGGFAGSESTRAARDPATNVTILSGDIDNNDTNTDGNTIAESPTDIQGTNAYHVVTMQGGADVAVLDGVTITAGDARGSGDAAHGGGVYMTSAIVLYDGTTNVLPTDPAATNNGAWVSFTTADEDSPFSPQYFGTQVANTGFTRFDSRDDDTTTANRVLAGYNNYANVFLTNLVNRSFPTLRRSEGYTVTVQAQVNQSTAETVNRGGFTIITGASDAGSGVKANIDLQFRDGEIIALDDNDGNGLFLRAENTSGTFNPVGAGFVDYTLAILNNTYTLSDGTTTLLTGNLRDYTPFVPPFPAPDPYEVPNFIFFGDNTGGARGQVDIAAVSLTMPAAGTLDNVTLVGNRAATGGGAVANHGGDLTISNSTITGNTASSTPGGAVQQAGGTLTLTGNTITANNGTPGLVQSGGSITAYANTITANNGGSTATQATRSDGTGSVRHNWWGCGFTACITGFAASDWQYRLGAPIVAWAAGDGSATLASVGSSSTTATLTGGTGTAVIVSHGTGDPANAPFGKTDGSTVVCSDFFDFFVVDASGTWDATVPLYDSPAACGSTTIPYVLDLTTSAPEHSTPCPAPALNAQSCYWNAYGGGVTVGSGTLTLSGLSVGDLAGTPIAAGDAANADPTSITLTDFTARPGSSALLLLLPVVVGLLAIIAIAVGMLRRRTH